jgi:SAM-dependent methyltransferase
MELARVELARPLPPPPLGACMLPIVEGYLKEVRAGDVVLDVGCGSWDRIKDHCERVGARYEAIDIDTEYFGKKTNATRIENLAELSFGDDEFDFVIGNQSMEHWAEHGCTLGFGLYQCFRVCKPGGKVLLNVPIHFHGTSEFMLGKLRRLKRLFARFSNTVRMEKWGAPCEPIPDYYPHPGYWRLRGKAAYVLSIEAVKDRPLPPRCSSAFGFRGRLAQLVRYPASYNVYRVLHKLRGALGGKRGA